MRRNIGHIDAYLRLVAGFLLLGWGLRSRHPARAFWLMLLGAGRIAEGLMRWCPFMAVLGIDSLTSQEQSVDLAPWGRRYARITHNPYRTYPEDDMTDLRPDDPQEVSADGVSSADLPSRPASPWRSGKS